MLNQCDAVSTDTMHRIKFNEGIEPERAILSYYNSISFAFTELCGRSYGGGVLEILPREVGEVFVPKLENISLETVRELLIKIDKLIRNGDNIEQVLDIVDSEVLVSLLEVEDEMCKSARVIWKKLQKRRLKRGQ